MRRAILIAVALSCFVSTEEAAAQSSEMTFTGAQLVTACTTADHEWIGFCNGYLQAAFDATGGRICAPKGITRNQVFDIVLPQLMNTTDLQKLNAFVAMDVLLHKAFPCNQAGEGSLTARTARTPGMDTIKSLALIATFIGFLSIFAMQVSL